MHVPCLFEGALMYIFIYLVRSDIAHKLQTLFENNSQKYFEMNYRGQGSYSFKYPCKRLMSEVP